MSVQTMDIVIGVKYIFMNKCNYMKIDLKKSIFLYGHIERRKKKMNDWYWTKATILNIANKLSYMEELATIISKTEIANSKDKTLCKKWIIDVCYDLNRQLIMYMDDVLMRMGINRTSKSIYYDFYRYVFDSANELKEIVFHYLDTGETEIVNIHYRQNDELLNDIIRETNRHIKNAVMKEVD